MGWVVNNAASASGLSVSLLLIGALGLTDDDPEWALSLRDIEKKMGREEDDSGDVLDEHVHSYLASIHQKDTYFLTQAELSVFATLETRLSRRVGFQSSRNSHACQQPRLNLVTTQGNRGALPIEPLGRPTWYVPSWNDSVKMDAAVPGNADG